MKYLIFVFISFTLGVHNNAYSQTLPAEGAKLNYRIIGFSFPKTSSNAPCTLEIAKGTCNDTATFAKNIIGHYRTDKNRIIAEVPGFGEQYSWRVVSSIAGDKPAIHHFSTLYFAGTDANKQRVNVLKKSENHKDDLIFMDGSRALYDMNGYPVWFLPNIADDMTDATQIRDLKMTPQGTITFICSDSRKPEVYELDVNGKILWKGPNTGIVGKDSFEHYHHEFTKLHNGNYMVLGSERPDPIKKIDKGPDGLPKRLPVLYGTIIEYNAKGEIVWSWNSSKWFTASDVVNYRHPETHLPITDVHDNSFYFDEKNGVIYVSYKEISRILKIKYPEGTVLASFGVTYGQNGTTTGSVAFCGQHSIKGMDNGDLLLFNNNDCSADGKPAAIELRDVATEASETLDKVWEYSGTGSEPIAPLQVDPNRPALQQQNQTPDAPKMAGPMKRSTGGNAIQLSNGDVLISECSPYGNIMIVTRDKQIDCNMLLMRLDPNTGQWMPTSQYRASIISEAQLEGLIWSGNGY